MDVFESFENDVIATILEETDNEFAPIIIEQYKNSTVISREFTGVGFYTNFQLNNKSLLLEDDICIRLGNIHADVNDLKYGAGFILFIKNGAICQLEGFSYEEEWPKTITTYKLSIVKSNGSLRQHT